jgi:hypothetical protein
MAVKRINSSSSRVAAIKNSSTSGPLSTRSWRTADRRICHFSSRRASASSSIDRVGAPLFSNPRRASMAGSKPGEAGMLFMCCKRCCKACCSMGYLPFSFIISCTLRWRGSPCLLPVLCCTHISGSSHDSLHLCLCQKGARPCPLRLSSGSSLSTDRPMDRNKQELLRCRSLPFFAPGPFLLENRTPVWGKRVHLPPQNSIPPSPSFVPMLGGRGLWGSPSYSGRYLAGLRRVGRAVRDGRTNYVGDAACPFEGVSFLPISPYPAPLLFKKSPPLLGAIRAVRRPWR